jgi:hypothetical protein
MLEDLHRVVEKAWNGLSHERREATTKDEIARMVMLIALAGQLDEQAIVRAVTESAPAVPY